MNTFNAGVAKVAKAASTGVSKFDPSIFLAPLLEALLACLQKKTAEEIKDGAAAERRGLGKAFFRLAVRRALKEGDPSLSGGSLKAAVDKALDMVADANMNEWRAVCNEALAE